MFYIIIYLLIRLSNCQNSGGKRSSDCLDLGPEFGDRCIRPGNSYSELSSILY